MLSNLLLDELDRELEARGLRFSRYADDCNVFVKRERAGKGVLQSLTNWLEEEASASGQPAKECRGPTMETQASGVYVHDRSQA